MCWKQHLLFKFRRIQAHQSLTSHSYTNPNFIQYAWKALLIKVRQQNFVSGLYCASIALMRSNTLPKQGMNKVRTENNSPNVQFTGSNDATCYYTTFCALGQNTTPTSSLRSHAENGTVNCLWKSYYNMVCARPPNGSLGGLGMRLHAVTQQSKKSTLGQGLPERQACRYITPCIVRTKNINTSNISKFTIYVLKTTIIHKESKKVSKKTQFDCDYSGTRKVHKPSVETCRSATNT